MSIQEQASRAYVLWCSKLQTSGNPWPSFMGQSNWIEANNGLARGAVALRPPGEGSRYASWFKFSDLCRKYEE